MKTLSFLIPLTPPKPSQYSPIQILYTPVGLVPWQHQETLWKHANETFQSTYFTPRYVLLNDFPGCVVCEWHHHHSSRSLGWSTKLRITTTTTTSFHHCYWRWVVVVGRQVERNFRAAVSLGEWSGGDSGGAGWLPPPETCTAISESHTIWVLFDI